MELVLELVCAAISNLSLESLRGHGDVETVLEFILELLVMVMLSRFWRSF